MATLNRDQQIEEIINLEAILNLPKGTEHFVSDLHGEFEAFDHILRNGSGRIREKVQFYLNKIKCPSDGRALFYYLLSRRKINTFRK